MRILKTFRAPAWHGHGSAMAVTRLVFDFAFENNAAESKALVRQLAWVYSASRRAANPFDQIVMLGLQCPPPKPAGSEGVEAPAPP